MKPLLLLHDFVDILYPDLCLACSEPLRKFEKIICLQCQVNLPRTDYMYYDDNPVAKKFWGRVPLQGAMALYHFHKSSRIQRLMHNLKYRGRRDVGLQLGKLLGFHLMQCAPYNTADLIATVPMHPAKQAKRGYNQSELIGEGLAEIMHIPFNRHALQKVRQTESQTKKNRAERWLNVKDIFVLSNAMALRGKHILLIDDVVTTGATLEACAHTLASAEQVCVSIAAIAHAEL